MMSSRFGAHTRATRPSSRPPVFTACACARCIRLTRPRDSKRLAEFGQHFLDSYVPLIVRAREHNQLLLAWRGWPAPSERLWGVITHVHGADLCGQTPGHGGRTITLAGPALQVYVVEEIRFPETPPNASSLFLHAVRQAHDMWVGEWADDPSLRTGEAAYEAWMKALRTAPRSRAGTPAVHEQHSLAVSSIAAARRQLAQWLRSIANELADNHKSLAQRWAAACDRVGEQLRPFCPPRTTQTIFDEPDGAERICAAINDTEDTERDLHRGLAALLDECPAT